MSTEEKSIFMSEFATHKRELFELLFWLSNDGPVAVVATRNYEALCKEFQEFLKERLPQAWDGVVVKHEANDSVAIQYPSGGSRFVFSSDDIHMQFIARYRFQIKIDTARLRD